MTLTLRSGCKINLFLHIGARRADGYHEIESVFLPLESPYDVMEIRRETPGKRDLDIAFYSLDDPSRVIPDIDPADNTLAKAYALYAEATGFAPSLTIRALKGVPSGGGLGGGSADAACLLTWLQALASKEKGASASPEALFDLAKRVGADVPFFLLSKPAFVSGIGERLQRVDISFPGRFLLLACPPLSISTAWAFAALDAERDAAGRKNSLTSGRHYATNTPLAGWEKYGNDFEKVVFARHPQLARLKDKLTVLGAQVVRMSGAGASVFAIFQDEAALLNAKKKVAKDGTRAYVQRLYAGV